MEAKEEGEEAKGARAGAAAAAGKEGEDDDVGKKGEKEAEGEGEGQVTLLSVDLMGEEEGEKDLTDGLEFEMEFTTARTLRGVWWEVSFVVDSVSARIKRILGRTEEEDYPRGETHTVSFAVDGVDVSGIEPGALSNVGLLAVTLKDGNDIEMVTVNMVVDVQRKSGREPGFSRTIFSPLEE